MCEIWKKKKKKIETITQVLEVFLTGVGTALRLEKDAWSMVK